MFDIMECLDDATTSSPTVTNFSNPTVTGINNTFWDFKSFTKAIYVENMGLFLQTRPMSCSDQDIHLRVYVTVGVATST